MATKCNIINLQKQTQKELEEETMVTSKFYNRKEKQTKTTMNEDSVFEGNKNPNASFFSNTSCHTSEINCPNWGDIYKIFINGDFPIFK